MSDKKTIIENQQSITSGDYTIEFNPVIDPTVKILNSNDPTAIRIEYDDKGDKLTFNKMFKDVDVKIDNVNNTLTFSVPNRTNELNIKNATESFTYTYNSIYTQSIIDQHIEDIKNLLKNAKDNVSIQYSETDTPTKLYTSLIICIHLLGKKNAEKNAEKDIENAKLVDEINNLVKYENIENNLEKIILVQEMNAEESNEYNNNTILIKNTRSNITNIRKNIIKLDAEIKILTAIHTNIIKICKNIDESLKDSFNILYNVLTVTSHSNNYTVEFIKEKNRWSIKQEKGEKDTNDNYCQIVNVIVSNIKSYFNDKKLIDDLSKEMNTKLKKFTIGHIINLNEKSPIPILKNIINMCNFLDFDTLLENTSTDTLDMFQLYQTHINDPIKFTPIVAYIFKNKNYGNVPIDFCFDCKLSVPNIINCQTVLCISGTEQQSC